MTKSSISVHYFANFVHRFDSIKLYLFSENNLSKSTLRELNILINLLTVKTDADPRVQFLGEG